MWLALLVLAAVVGVRAVAGWLGALASGAPILYGEGAVAHAGQLLARGVDPYAATPTGTFVAANYPPLSFLVVALGARLLPDLGVFATLRMVSIAATLAIAALVAWRARRAPVVAAALAFSFLALLPVQSWGPAHKPDPLAVTLAAGAVLVAGASWRQAIGGGVLAALALYAKPTAALPLGALALYLLWRERRTGLRFSLALAGLVVLLAFALAVAFDREGLYTHLVTWNALAYEPPIAVAFFGLLTVSAFGVVAALRGDGRWRAYLAGAFAVVLLGGREGATINYLLDLGAASCLAMAPALTTRHGLTAALLAGQLVVALALSSFGAFGAAGTWARPERVGLAADIVRTDAHLAEDSGVLVANRIEPEVDDLFLWSRLVARGVFPDEITPRVRAGEFASVIADVPLDALGGGSVPAYERLRWPEELVRAVLANYRLDRAAPGHYRYVRRIGVAHDGP